MVQQANENHTWLAKNGQVLEKYSGKWVAIDQSKLVAAANSLKELSEKIEVKSAKHPLFFLVPRPEEELSIL